MVSKIERGVSISIWELIQNTETKEITLKKFGHEIKKYQSEKLLDEAQMQDMLLTEMYKGVEE